MDHDSVTEKTIISMSAPFTRQAQVMIGSCEACSPDNAEIPFEWIIDRITR
jgi:hypothetical protein